MRILTWNINGIRTIPQYHPWNTLKDTEGILNHLQADIICFQEMKTSRQALDRSAALPASYDAFFSFPVSKGGYSGVAVYTRKASAVPLRAEEGLSGTLPEPKNISFQSSNDRISKLYPLASSLSLYPNVDGATDSPEYPISLAHLDIEGRSLILDFGLFVLINLYCPNETSDARLPFKMNFHLMLEERVRHLIRVEGREVIVVGDINICAAPDDHCEGHLQSDRSTPRGGTVNDSGTLKDDDEGDYMAKYVKEQWKGRGFWRHPAREWLRRWIDQENGVLVDVLRKFWPDRKGMYTCWNTKIGARATNYGTRIDYILVTRRLLPWIKAADISPEVKGSDHCPVWMDMHDEIDITADDGTKHILKLRDVMHQDIQPDREPPRLASKWWNEYSGKQTLLSSFFSIGSAMTSKNSGPSQSQAGGSATPRVTPSPHTSTSDAVQATRISAQTSDSNPGNPGKRRLAVHTLHGNGMISGKSKKQRTAAPRAGKGQAKLSNFFDKSLTKVVPPIHEGGTTTDGDTVPANTAVDLLVDLDAEIQDQIETDYQYAYSLSQPSSQERMGPNNDSKMAWNSIMAPIKPPKCLVHREPATEYTVKKPGPNKGKKFFICSRPVGPGYDKGKTERLRKDVDPQWRCNFFKWSSEVRRDLEKQRKAG